MLLPPPPFEKCPDCGSSEVTTQWECNYKFQYGVTGDAVMLQCKRPFRVGKCNTCDFSWTGAGTPDDAEEVIEETVNQYKELRDRFLDLARQWSEETGNQSNMQARQRHPAYQEMRGMGDDIVPLLLEAMRKHEPDDHWFILINDIVGRVINIPMELRGCVREIEDIYVRWGLESNLIA